MFLVVFFQMAFALSNAQPALDTYYNNVVMLKINGVDENNSPTPGYCNGTLLAPNVIITAAHCASQAWVMKDFNIQVSPGYYKYATRPDGTPFRVGYVYLFRKDTTAKFNMKPSLIQRLASGGMNTKIPPEEDIVYITLPENLPLPADFKFAKILSEPARSKVLQNPLAYYPQIVSENFIEEATNNDTKRVASLNDLKYVGNSFESKSVSRVAPLDSGSPIFVTYNGEKYVLAVVKGVGQTFFGNWDVFALADSW